MKVLQEGNLSVSIDGELQAWKFDGPSHGLSHCMKAWISSWSFPVTISSWSSRIPNIQKQPAKVGKSSFMSSWVAVWTKT